jgi:hypothetical protein
MRCSICHTLLQPEVERQACPECSLEYHKSCWDELGGCATYGCARAVPATKPAPARMGGGWGDTKTCPACKKEIASSLLLCRCGARFPYADPMTREEHLEWVAAERGRTARRRTLLLLFLASLLGPVAILSGPTAGFLAQRWRELLAGAGGVYLGLGYGAAALGAIQALTIALLALGA